MTSWAFNGQFCHSRKPTMSTGRASRRSNVAPPPSFFIFAIIETPPLDSRYELAPTLLPSPAGRRRQRISYGPTFSSGSNADSFTAHSVEPTRALHFTAGNIPDGLQLAHPLHRLGLMRAACCHRVASRYQRTVARKREGVRDETKLCGDEAILPCRVELGHVLHRLGCRLDADSGERSAAESVSIQRRNLGKSSRRCRDREY